MTSPQNLDSAFCLLASLISKQVANPAQLKRDLELGAKHFQAANPELGSLLSRMSEAVKGAETMATKTGPGAEHALGHSIGLQALLFSVIRSMDNSHEVFANFHTEIEHARVALLDAQLSDDARAGLDQMVAAVRSLQQEL